VLASDRGGLARLACALGGMEPGPARARDPPWSTRTPSSM